MSYVERLVINDESKKTILYDEHMVRYRFIAPLVHGKKILDIACGSGYGAAFLAEAGAESVIGIDLDPEAIKTAQETYDSKKISFRSGDATKLDLPDASIDFVSSFETIEHLPNIEAYLKELVRVTTNDALVCISTPNKTVFGQKNPFHIKEFTKDEFEAVLRIFFPAVRIFEQKNGLSSVIIGKKGNSAASISVTDTGSEALYFIAICSKKEFSHELNSVASINIPALLRWENNPGWKLVNSIYRVLQKLGIRS